MIGAEIIDLLFEHRLPEVFAYKFDYLQRLTHPGFVLAIPVMGHREHGRVSVSKCATQVLYLIRTSVLLLRVRNNIVQANNGVMENSRG